MRTKTTSAPGAQPVKQFSIFLANRLGRLHDLVGLLARREIHVLAITILDTTDSAIIRLVVDDPDQARGLFAEEGFPFTESNVVVVELPSAAQLPGLMAALLEAELNINYLYSFIPHPGEKSLLALSMEDNEVAEEVLARHLYRLLKQTDISR